MNYFLPFAITGALLSGAAVALPPTPAPQEASIAFADHGSIQTWQADSDQAVYVQGDNHQWYHATLMGPCLDLRFAEAIGFETRGTGNFDRFSTLIVRGQRCQVQSVVKSAPPPRKNAKPKS
jgi:hypothetical protein